MVDQSGKDVYHNAVNTVRASCKPGLEVLVVTDYAILGNCSQEVEQEKIGNGGSPHYEGQGSRYKELVVVQVQEIAKSPGFDNSNQGVYCSGHESVLELQFAHQAGNDDDDGANRKGNWEGGRSGEHLLVGVNAVGTVGLEATWTDAQTGTIQEGEIALTFGAEVSRSALVAVNS